MSATLQELVAQLEKVLHEELPEAARECASFEANLDLKQVVTKLDSLQRQIGMATFEMYRRGEDPAQVLQPARAAAPAAAAPAAPPRPARPRSVADLPPDGPERKAALDALLAAAEKGEEVVAAERMEPVDPEDQPEPEPAPEGLPDEYRFCSARPCDQRSGITPCVACKQPYCAAHVHQSLHPCLEV